MRRIALHGPRRATALLVSHRSFSAAEVGTEAPAAPLPPHAEDKRVARGVPRFQQTRGFLGAFALVVSCGLGMWAIRKVYFHFRAGGNNKAIMMRLQDELRLHPHWAAALLYSMAHHVISDAPTPFGSPMVCPPFFEKDLRDILLLLREVQLQYPGTSLPDLWACVTTYAIASLGGPLVPPVWGRYEETFPPDPIEVRAAVINGDSSDLSDLKRLFARHDIPPDEMVSLMGHRTVGCHGSSVVYQYQLMKAASEEMLSSNRFVTFEGAPSAECPAYSTQTPGVFDNDYFTTLLAPWTVSTAEVTARDKKGWWQRWLSLFSPEKADGDCARTLLAYTDAYPYVRMEPLDVALKSDSLLLGWIMKFAENEIRFFTYFERAAARVMKEGWEGSRLHD